MCPLSMTVNNNCRYHLSHPTKDISTLKQWWGLGGQMILRAMPVVAQLLAEPPVPHRSKVTTQSKTDTLGLQVGGWASG
jgi:hypothetical protein